MGFFYIFTIILAAAFIRTISFGIWSIKNRSITAGAALFALAVLMAASGILFVLT